MEGAPGDQQADGAHSAPQPPTNPQLINPNLRLPPELNIISGNVSENFKVWKRQVEIFFIGKWFQ